MNIEYFTICRIDALNKSYQDITEFCNKFVPRDEVYEVKNIFFLFNKILLLKALKAIIGEVKMLKKNVVKESVFKDGMKKKADVNEVER